MDRGKTSPLVLLVGAGAFLTWSIVLLVTPGGSRNLEWIQLGMSGITAAYALYALKLGDPVHNRRCRYLLIVFALVGVVMVLGLGADQRSSRTWARLGWAALLGGYVGAIITWYRIPQHRAATVVLAGVGALLIAGGVGLTVNCDPTVQTSWCDPLYEQEQSLAEQIEVDGQRQRSGRAGGSQGAALVAYFIDADDSIEEITDPPGEWDYEQRPLQSIEIQRGRYTTDDGQYTHCRLDVKVEVIPQGTLETIYVTCGGAG